MKNFQKKKKTDVLDKVAFYNWIIIGTEDEPARINCPYPDKLSQELDCFTECEICQGQDTCSAYIEEFLFPIFEGYTPEGSNLK